LLGERLSQEHFDLAYTSDLKRAKDTADLISDQFIKSEREILFKQDPRLREKSSGIYEGYPIGTTFMMAKEAGIDNRLFKPTGGENWMEVNERLKSFLAYLVQKSNPNN
jgi:broad specificity phosphatase PhoE